MLRHIFRTLRYRNYRLFFAGQSISLIGTWIQQLAMSWLVYRLTGSAYMLGLVGFLTRIPTFFLAPFAGVMADRWPRYRLLVVTQALSMLQAAVLALLVLTGIVQVWHVAVLGFCLGLINSFDVPIRQSFVVEMIEKREDLGNAIALNSTMVNGARLVGPALAGVLIAVVGEGWCFAINAASFVAVLASLLAMRVPAIMTTGHRASHLEALQQGFRYVFGFLPVRSILLLLALVSMMGMPFQVLMPVFAKNILGGGPHTLGFLMTAVGLGALAGAVHLASRRNPKGLERELALASVVFGIGLGAFALSHNLWLSWISLSLAGLGMLVQLTGSNTLLQSLVDDEMRGRVMSFYAMAFMGTVPLGNILAGVLAESVGAPNTVLFGGICCVLGGAAFAWKLPKIARQAHPGESEQGLPGDLD